MTRLASAAVGRPASRTVARAGMLALAVAALMTSAACRTTAPSAAATPAQTPARPPNIIVVMADDLGYGDVGFLNPESKIRTPSIDRLAREGFAFMDAHTVGGVCTPARYALLTGRYGWRTRLPSGVLDGYAPSLIEAGRLTLPALLRRQGYTTAAIGKWHLGMSFGVKAGVTPPADPTQTLPPDSVDYAKPVTAGPNAAGFDYFFGMPSSVDIPPYVLLENERVLQPATVPLVSPPGMLGFRPGLAAADFRHVDFMPLAVRKTREYLETRAKDRQKPFFLFIPTTGVHNPIVPSAEFAGKSAVGPYGDFVEQLDDVLGHLLRDLAELDLERDTIVVFTSDNGPAPLTTALRQQFGHDSAGGLRGIKGSVYEGGQRLPLVVRWPGRVQAGARSTELVSSSDLMATFAALSRVTLPADAAEDSFNFLPVLLGQTTSGPIRPSIVFHADNGTLAVRQGPLKLIPGPTPQLYDVVADLKETRNLAAERPDDVARLTALLQTIRTSGRERPAGGS